jgi:hypothetical protein
MNDLQLLETPENYRTFFLENERYLFCHSFSNIRRFFRCQWNENGSNKDWYEYLFHYENFTRKILISMINELKSIGITKEETLKDFIDSFTDDFKNAKYNFIDLLEDYNLTKEQCNEIWSNIIWDSCFIF